MLVEMKDICKDYPQGKETVRILKNVNLQVEEGDYLAIMGPSGSGKTTLMNLIGCLDVPTSGEYLLTARMSPRPTKTIWRRSATAARLCVPELLSAAEALGRGNVALPLLYAGVNKKERRERAIEALQMMGLGQRLNFRPNQLSGRSVPARRHCACHRGPSEAAAGGRADRRPGLCCGQPDHGYFRRAERRRLYDHHDHA